MITASETFPIRAMSTKSRVRRRGVRPPRRPTDFLQKKYENVSGPGSNCTRRRAPKDPGCQVWVSHWRITSVMGWRVYWKTPSSSNSMSVRGRFFFVCLFQIRQPKQHLIDAKTRSQSHLPSGEPPNRRDAKRCCSPIFFFFGKKMSFFFFMKPYQFRDTYAFLLL